MGRKQQRSKHNYASVEGILSIYCDNNNIIHVYTFTQTVYFATDIAFSYITHSDVDTNFLFFLSDYVCMYSIYVHCIVISLHTLYCFVFYCMCVPGMGYT